VLAGLKRAQYDAIGIESSAAWEENCRDNLANNGHLSLDDLEANRKIDLGCDVTCIGAYSLPIALSFEIEKSSE
jgi:hypothetical protein